MDHRKGRNELKMDSRILKVKEEIKKRQPEFCRQDAHKKRLKIRWVKTRGLHSKVRLRRAGHSTIVSTGFRGPREIRGYSKEGLKIIMLFNEEGASQIDKKNEVAMISGRIGLKKRLAVLKKCTENGIKVLNIDAKEFIAKKEEELKKKAESKKTKTEQKQKKKEEKKKEEKLEEKLSDEEKKEKEKQEKDKLLTQR